jgi:hypothetical protein
MLAAMLACSTALATAGLAATLKITVPATVHNGQNYKVKVTGTYKPRELEGTAFLVAFLQYSGKHCQASARAEFGLPASERDLDFAGNEPKSPFTNVERWTAHNRYGPRRVCAYLYPKPVGPSDSVRPIARVGKLFRDAR